MNLLKREKPTPRKGKKWRIVRILIFVLLVPKYIVVATLSH